MLRQVSETEYVIYYTYTQDSLKTFYRGEKRYELSNHLGNVLAVITDRRIQACGAGDDIYYNAQVVSVSDYYPFGMGIKEREWSDSSFGYRFGFNGKEQDNEVAGEGNSYDFGARIYDSRLGRWMSRDPNFKDYPYRSDYSYVGNSPIFRIDPNGRWEIEVHAFTERSKFGYGIAIVKNDAGDVLFRTVVRLEGTGGTNHFTRNANTPTGTYTIDGWAEWASASISNRVSYGPNEVLKLTPYSGEVKTTGRGGIHNHGGRQEWQTKTGFVERSDQDTKLGKTHGCIRWFDEDIKEVRSLTDGILTDGMPEQPTFQNITDDLVYDDKTERYFIPDELNALNTLRQEESNLTSMVSFLREQLGNPGINVNSMIGGATHTLTSQQLEQEKQKLTEVKTKISEQSELGINTESLVPVAE